MTPMTSPELEPTGGAGRSTRRWWILGGLLLVVAIGFLGRGLWVADAEPVPVPAVGSAVASPSAVAPAVPAAPPVEGGAPGAAGAGGAAAPGAISPVGRSAPVSLRIPAIGVSVAVGELGLNEDRTVQVPTDFALPGWYRLGTAPGQVGSAVILGHVDSYRGPAVFYRLRSLTAGDEVEVTLADGAVVRFAVTDVEMYPKTEFPAEQVYGSHGESVLALVTCGGEFDSTARSYRSNVVAYASLVGSTPAASAPN